MLGVPLRELVACFEAVYAYFLTVATNEVTDKLRVFLYVGASVGKFK